MHFLYTGDWQASTKNLDRCEMVLSHLLAVIKELKVDRLALLGDMKESKNPVDQRVTNFLVHLADRVTAKVPTCIIAGNHDRILLEDTSDTGLPIFKKAGCATFEIPGIWNVDNKWRMWCVPHFRDPKKAQAALEEGKRQGLNLAIFHNEVSGSWNNPSNKMGPGIDPAVFHGYKCCVGGHIHFHQQLAKNAWFAGSPFCQDWGEANQRKGFFLLDTDTNSVKLIPTPLPMWYDPTLPGDKPESWSGVPVRINVPLDLRAAEQVRAMAKKRYPDALFHWRPEKRGMLDADLNVEGVSDDQLIPQFLKQNPIWSRPKEVVAYLKYKMSDLGSGLRGLHGGTLKSVTASNVLCFKDEVTLFLDRPGLTLITARNLDWPGRSNGGGKTSLVSLPLIAFGGQTDKEQKHDSWVRRRSKDTARIVANFQLPDNRNLQVLRTRQPGDFRLIVNGQDKTMGDVHKTQRLLEEYTGLTWKVMTAALYLGQHEVVTLLTGGPAERKDLFNQLIGLQRFVIAGERIKGDLKKARSAHINASEQLRDAERDLEEAQRRVDESGALLKREQELRKGLVSASAKLSGLQIKVTEGNDKADGLRATCNGFSETLSAIAVEVAGREAQVAILERQIKAGAKQGICPVCQQPLPKSKVVPMDHLKQEVQKLLAELQDIEAHAVVQRNGRKKAKLKYEECWNQLESTKAELRVAQHEHSFLTGQLKGLPSAAAFDGEKELKRCSRYVALLKLTIAGLDEQQEFLQACQRVVSRDGLPAYLCTLTAPQLNQVADELSDAFAEAQIRVNFSTADGDLDLVVDNPMGGENTSDQSKGEMRLAAIIASLAIRLVLAPYNLLILDEPGDGLDPCNARVFAQGLHQVASRFGSLFLITHNSAILDCLEYDYHLEVVKQGGVSVVKEL